MMLVRVTAGDAHVNGRVGCLYINSDGVTLIFFGDFTTEVGTSYYDCSFEAASLEYMKLTEGY